MLRFIANRLLQGLLVLFALYSIVFFLAKAMPGEPFTTEKNVSEETKRAQRAQFGLDRSIWVQYVAYPWNVVTTGSLSRSLTKGKPVRDIIAQAFPVSLVLGVAAPRLRGRRRRAARRALLRVAEHMGRLEQHGGRHDRHLRAGLHHRPALSDPDRRQDSGDESRGWGAPQDILLPAITLGLLTAAYIARLTRGGMLEVLGHDYIRTARAKGLPPSRVITRHALRGGLLPSVAYLGPRLRLSGERQLHRRDHLCRSGNGPALVNAAKERDEFLLIGVALFFGILIVTMNLVSDILTGVLDPRVRLGQDSKAR